MTGPSRYTRVRDAQPAVQPLRRREPDRHALRQDFAAKVVRRLADASRVAVLDDNGRPILISCSEWMYELLAKDHPIVGIYTPGARIKHIIEDLEAAGL